ncbi:MAG: hypothetical protein LBS03_04580 [Bacteroidales bacterium]|jgi:hypothetical protein|nr:hypothetical protein [Bacteroidales bacterium]
MNRQIFFLLVLTAGFLLACSKNETETRLLEEEQALDEWVKRHYAEAKKLSNGLYIRSEESSGEKPEAGQFVLLNYRLRLLDNMALEKTSYAITDETPVEKSLYKFGGPEIWQLTAPLAGISAGIAQMSEEQTGTIFFSSRYNELTGFNFDYRSRILEMELVKIISALSLYQDTLCHFYIAQQSQKVDTVVTRTVTDVSCHVMYGIVGEGTGESVDGKTTVRAKVEARYALRKNESILFAQPEKAIDLKNDPNFNSYTVDNYLNKILKPLKIGSKIRLAMPYVVFYGSNVEEDDGQVVVPMRSVIILDIEIVE